MTCQAVLIQKIFHRRRYTRQSLPIAHSDRHTHHQKLLMLILFQTVIWPKSTERESISAAMWEVQCLAGDSQIVSSLSLSRGGPDGRVNVDIAPDRGQRIIPCGPPRSPLQEGVSRRTSRCGNGMSTPSVSELFRIAWLSSISAIPTDATCTHGRTESVMDESANAVMPMTGVGS